jgi:nucleotide-binding universal stress UspA family protein
MDGLIKRILVYIDGTIKSITAAQYSIALAHTTRAELYALHVVNTKALTDLVRAHIFLKEEEEEYTRDLQSDADKYLNHIRNIAASKNVPVIPIKASGNIHEIIKTNIDELKIDLLIVGELSKIKSRRDEFFNEIERAVRNVTCSVLIVRDEDRVFDIFEKLV